MPNGGVQERILHMLIEDLVKVVELPEDGPDERRPIMGSLGELSDAEDGKGYNNANDVEGDHHQG